MRTIKKRSHHGTSEGGSGIPCATPPKRAPRLFLSAPLLTALLLTLLTAVHPARAQGRLPFGTVFQGQSQFDRLVQRAAGENWSALPIGQRTATVGRALVGTPYKSFTLEIDDRIEAASANLDGVDCWTFFEISLGSIST